MRSAAQPPDANLGQVGDSIHATAQTAGEEECFGAAIDLREIAQKLGKHKFQKKAKLMDGIDHKAMLVPGGKFLSTFDSSTWTMCFSEWWYGDALPNMSEQKQNPKLT